MSHVYYHYYVRHGETCDDVEGGLSSLRDAKVICREIVEETGEAHYIVQMTPGGNDEKVVYGKRPMMRKIEAPALQCQGTTEGVRALLAEVIGLLPQSVPPSPWRMQTTEHTYNAGYELACVEARRVVEEIRVRLVVVEP